MKKKKTIAKNQWSKEILLKPRYLKGIQWSDRCETLIHYMFEHLCLFLEQEADIIQWWDNEKDYKKAIKTAKSKKNIGFPYVATITAHRKAKKEMDFLYIWWTEARPAYVGKSPFIDAFERKHPEFYKMKTNFDYISGKKQMEKSKENTLLNKEYRKAMKKDWEYDAWVESEDKKMMKRLIDIKEYLWS